MSSAEQLMTRALELAAHGRARTHPNPRVGCVIVKNGEIVGEGWHEKAGGPHAEVRALEAAGAKAKGADVYVTLEPCCHQGRTPPCTKTLINAGVKRVIAAMEDPNPKVAGQGFAALRGAGIEVDVGVMEDAAQDLNRGFVSRMARGRPWLTLKLAMSLDGRTALASGESKWITGEAARADVHRLRAEAGAVMTSVSTLVADDPELSVRYWPDRHEAIRGVTASPNRTPATPSLASPVAGNRAVQGTIPIPRQPDRIVLDTQLRAPADAQAFKPGARRIVLTVRPRSDRMEALKRAGVEVVLVGPSIDGHVGLASALSELGRLEINEVFLECGPKLAGSVLRSGLMDEVLLYVAPSLFGHEGRALAELPDVKTLDQRLNLHYRDVRQIGADLRITLRPKDSVIPA